MWKSEPWSLRARMAISPIDPLEAPPSPNHRFVIALHSPDGTFEIGLRCPGEKTLESLAAGSGGTLSLVRFDGETCAIVAISSDFQKNAAGFLCNPDCVAERVVSR
jgi:hypothetical protein